MSASTDRYGGFHASIVRGPAHGELLQRERAGGARVDVGGTWSTDGLAPAAGDAYVVVRVVRDDDRSSVLPWTRAESLASGSWSATLDLPMGGPYSIESALHNGSLLWLARGDCVSEIYVGDLWLVAGQSNAVGYGREPVLDPPVRAVRVLDRCVRWTMAVHPLFRVAGRESITLEDGQPGHGPALSFARTVNESSGVPLLPLAEGSSYVVDWVPGGRCWEKVLPVLRRSAHGAAGLLWWQGEIDANAADGLLYRERLAQVVAAFRDETDRPDLPVVVTQIGRYVTDERDEACWQVVREAQRSYVEGDAHAFLVPTIDSRLSDEVHCSSDYNVEVGRRWAAVVLPAVYGFGSAARPPSIARAVLDGRDLALVVDDLTGEVVGAGLPPYGIRCTDDLGDIDVERVELGGARVRLRLGRETVGPVHVEHAAARNPVAHLRDIPGGWPILPARLVCQDA